MAEIHSVLLKQLTDTTTFRFIVCQDASVFFICLSNLNADSHTCVESLHSHANVSSVRNSLFSLCAKWVFSNQLFFKQCRMPHYMPDCNWCLWLCQSSTIHSHATSSRPQTFIMWGEKPQNSTHFCFCCVSNQTEAKPNKVSIETSSKIQMLLMRFILHSKSVRLMRKKSRKHPLSFVTNVCSGGRSIRFYHNLLYCNPIVKYMVQCNLISKYSTNNGYIIHLETKSFFFFIKGQIAVAEDWSRLPSPQQCFVMSDELCNSSSKFWIYPKVFHQLHPNTLPEYLNCLLSFWSSTGCTRCSHQMY